MGRMSWGSATRTRPAPLRRAALPHSTAAPDMPRLPATTRTRPKVPLLLSAARGGRTGRRVTTSRVMGCVLLSRDLRRRPPPDQDLPPPRPPRQEARRTGWQAGCAVCPRLKKGRGSRLSREQSVAIIPTVTPAGKTSGIHVHRHFHRSGPCCDLVRGGGRGAVTVG